MPRIPYPDPASLPEDVRQRLGATPPNVSRMMAGASAGVFHGFANLTRAFFEHSPLSARLREIAILRVGYLSNAPYETFQHETFARHIGVSQAEIDAVREGEAKASILGEAGAAVLAFTDDLVRNVRPGDETLSGVRAHLSDTEVLDLIMVVGAYIGVCRFLEATGVEIDERSIDWAAREASWREKPVSGANG